MTTTKKHSSRRRFLKAASATTAGALMAGLPKGWVGAAYADDSPEVSTMRFGIIALTDCAPIVMAHELGYFKKFGIESVSRRKPRGRSFATSSRSAKPRHAHADRHADRLDDGAGRLAGEADGHPVAASTATAGDHARQHAEGAGVKTPRAQAARGQGEGGGDPMSFAMTFPPGTHAMWIRYWLASGGINPDKDVNLITIPPPQMVANMKVGKMQGFCVGEPWNNRAIEDNIGFTGHHHPGDVEGPPEKVCAFTEEFATKNPKTVKAVLKALHLASVHLDDMKNRPAAAEVIARPAYINCPPAIILER
jgi:nitrate/nitrite transport system substrate-binding protein